MRFLDMINVVAETTGVGKRDSLPTGAKNQIIDWININYEKVWNAYPWEDIKEIELSLTTSDGIITLPNYVDDVIAVRNSTTPLPNISVVHVHNHDPDDLDGAGTPAGWYHISASPVLTPLAAAGIVKIASSSASDSSGTVRVEGVLNNETVFEEASLNGTTKASTTQTFDVLHNLTKPTTVGRVTIYNSSDAALATISPQENRARYKRIKLRPIVGSSTTIKVMCRRKFERMSSNHDSLLLSRAETAILKLTIADIFAYLGKMDKGGVYRNQGEEELNIAVRNETRINAKANQVLPLSGVFGRSGISSWDITVTGKSLLGI